MTISLSRETIRLMMQSQRMIKKEFGVRIELDDDQVMARVFAYAAQSASDELKDCANALMHQLIPGSEEAATEQEPDRPSSAARIYRGQVVLAAKKPANPGTPPAGDAEGKKQVIYRGRRVG